MKNKTSDLQKKNKQLGELSLIDLKNSLAFSPEGLAQKEAVRRLEQYGRNELVEKEINPVLKFFGYFWGPIPWMIEVAIVLAAIVHDWPDFFIILTLLIVNAGVGFWEEFQAGNAIAALKATLALKAKVKRDGEWSGISAVGLVPGDLIRIRIGDIVPADAKLLEGDPIEVDQSALTGESLPVERKTGGIVYSGSILKRGEIDALVYATGEHTYFGETTRLVGETQTVSHFQRAIMKIGDYLIVVALVLVSIILVVAFFRDHNMLKSLEFVLILTVAAIPVAMPTVLSVTMAVGAKILAKKEVIVSRLASIEELAGIDVLCSDKTGTLTQNKLQLGDPFTFAGNSRDELILNAALASRREDEDVIDLTVLGGLKDPARLGDYQIIHFMPFDPVEKRTEATVKGPGGREFTVTKGAPQIILALTHNADEIKKEVEQKVSEFASRGFRSLGVARSLEKGKWDFLGILPMFDPPREDSKAMVTTAKAMGIDVKMLTGDQLAIAKETARQLDLGANILDAGSFADAKHPDAAQLEEEINNADGYAQVFPKHKYQIVAVLQKKGNIVGMTGDGVNDAPALKKSDVGIAVSGATDAARAAAAIVLLQAGLSVIIDAVKE
ncbi:MAG: plasma-membrane proton-efflux P-type ATPase, partial [Candidatus Omnitrophica bacterium]|nr:plasma-membrane proton-efflux P-type ATPase [Candidatus Omnitrophota bacterium]